MVSTRRSIVFANNGNGRICQVTLLFPPTSHASGKRDRQLDGGSVCSLRKTGVRPDGTTVASVMPKISAMTDEEARAVWAWQQTVPLLSEGL